MEVPLFRERLLFWAPLRFGGRKSQANKACYRDESYLLDDVLRNALSEVSSRAAALLANHGIVPLTQDIAESLQALF